MLLTPKSDQRLARILFDQDEPLILEAIINFLERKNLMSSAASVFSTMARSKVIIFECAANVQVGAYALRKGDGVKVVKDVDGYYNVNVAWAEGSFGHINAERVNELAGYEVIPCSCRLILGDDTGCEVHGKSAHWMGGE